MNGNVHYTVSEIVKITGGKLLHRNLSAPLPTHLSLDSRKITDAVHTIFFAIKTAHHDGNNFIENLYEKGVRNFITQNKNTDVSLLPLANVIAVENSIAALQKLAAHHRKKFNIEVIGITGSNGKTIVKEWLNQLLEKDFIIVRSPKSYNSQIGVALSILNIQKQDTLGIFEAGISLPDEMQHLEKMIRPAIGILTNIGNAHDEGFDDTTQKINEKLKLFIHARRLIFCSDNKQVKEAVSVFKNENRFNKMPFQCFTWGKESDNTLQITKTHVLKNETKIYAVFNKINSSITIPFIDTASIENAINCWCALLLLDFRDHVVVKKFNLLYPIAMRLELKQGNNNCIIINDSYSNDVHSLSIAVNFLEQQKQHKKYTVILSDILQSGKEPGELYKEVADILSHKKIIKFIGIGENISLHRDSFSFIKDVHFYATTDGFLKAMNALNFHDETILIKGARSFGFEQISHKLEQKAHQTVLSINLTSIAYNLKQYKSLLKPATKIMAMVKAFSYGSGGYEVAAVLEYNKADYLAVAYADEGVELRRAGITLPIMVMNAEPVTFDALTENNLEPEIYSFNILNQFTHFLKASAVSNYPVHIKIDTGMHRLGFTGDDIFSLCEKLKASPVKVVSVFSHLVASENKEEDIFTLQQAEIFRKCCLMIENELQYKFLKHIANTAAISRHKHLQMDMVRLGIGLYGIDNNEVMQQKLKNVTTLTTTVSQIKKVKKGETVGYGRTAKLMRDSVIATVRIGYADGYPRSLGNGAGKMLVKKDYAPVVSNVCMDMTMLDVTDLENLHEGDEVMVFGEALSLQSLATWTHTIPYEIMTGISQRVKRIYYEE